MQLMIDISHETPAALRLAAQFLLDHAAMIDTGGLPAYAGGVPFGINIDVPAGTTSSAPVPPTVAVPPPPTDNVVPFPTPPAPAQNVAAPSAIPPAPPAAVTPPALSAGIPVVPVMAPSAPQAPTVVSPVTTTTAGGADVYDSSGMPWDARIHQKSKATKKDGTFKLQKNIDAAIVTAVTQELASAGRIRTPNAVTNTPPSAGASPAPVSVPQAPTNPSAYQAGSLPIPPPPKDDNPEETARAQFHQNPYAQTGQAQGVAIPPPPPLVAQAEGQAQAGLVPPAPSAAVPVPPAPALGVSNAPQPGLVQTATDFRSFVAKVTAARTGGKITAEQVSALIQQAGAPSLQLLNSMPHLIPTADALLDAHLLMQG